jgi:hypothetical protein
VPRTDDLLFLERFDGDAKVLFDMKDGVPMRDKVGDRFRRKSGSHRELAQYFRDDSLRDDKDLEISLVNALKREVHRKLVHRD